MAAARRPALWSAEALDDRETIWDYYVRVAGRHTAEKIFREIAEVIALIEDHPFADARETRFVCRPSSRRFLSCRQRHAGNRTRTGWAAGYRGEVAARHGE